MIFKYSLFILLLLVNVVISANFHEEKNVLALEDGNLNSAVKTFQKLFVMFYSPSCPHCEKAMPEFEKAAKKLHKEGIGNIRLAKVDASTPAAPDRDKRKFNFNTVPQFYYINGDLVTQYHGGRKAADYIGYVKKKAGFSYKPIATVEELDKHRIDEDVYILGIFKDENSKEAEAYKVAATEVDGVDFGLSTTQELFDYFKIDGAHAIVALKKFDDGTSFFDDEWDVDDITDWTRKQRLPIVIDFDTKTGSAVLTGENPRHIIMIAKKSSADFLENYRIFKAVAMKFRFKFMFIFINADDKDHQNIINFFQTGPRDYPAVRAIGLGDEPSKVIKPEDATFSEEAITKFVTDVDSGRLAKRRGKLSLSEPENWDASPLKILTGDTFYHRVVGKDALVLFTKEHHLCPKCEDVERLFVEVAQEFQWNRQNLLIGKIDAEYNTVDRVETPASLPAIKFFPKGVNMALDYKGERTLESIVKYINSNMATKPAAAQQEHSEL